MRRYGDWAHEGYVESSVRLIKTMLAVVVIPLILIASYYSPKIADVSPTNNKNSLEIIVRN
ncbi:hypothetical protein COU59_01160 [Candidatus Pacearchaeota archaeon CG10_big_fil_rev_8_21_14_0_10_34_12]|nr:MAG: hypothetical protein COU59_01160 [Candidatus Pacearchaeota archaeon CG10_big_fil_rev_8_21_14_0_10_34_12]